FLEKIPGCCPSCHGKQKLQFDRRLLVQTMHAKYRQQQNKPVSLPPLFLKRLLYAVLSRSVMLTPDSPVRFPGNVPFFPGTPSAQKKPGASAWPTSQEPMQR